MDQKADGSICIHQISYREWILSKFNMKSTNVVHIPTDPQHTLDSDVS